MKSIAVILSFILLTQCGKESKQQLREYKEQVLNLSLKVSKLEAEKRNLEIELNSKKQERFDNEDFKGFFWRFMTDSAFQLSRIKFPLPFNTWKGDIGGEIITKNVNISDWNYDPFYSNSASERTQIYDNFKMQFQPSNKRLLHWYGIETGGDAKYYFEGFDGLWYLTKKEQLGD
jgi:hypothetical protein